VKPGFNTTGSRATSTYYYGWVIVAVSGLSLFVAFGVRLSFSVFFETLIREQGWPRADTAFVFSTTMIVFALTSTLAGLSLDRFGPRLTFGAGAVLLALGLLLSSQVQSLWQLTLSYGVVVGLGITILGLGPQAGLISNWFRKRRGMALGIAFAGTGLGTLILTPGAAGLIGLVGWRQAYAVLALLALLVLPLIVIFLRQRPADMGLRPDGATTQEVEENQHPERGEWTLALAMRSPAFWLVILASLVAIGPLRMLTVHQIAAVVDAGFDRLFAATVIGLSGAITAVAFVLWGALSDRIGRRAAYALGSLCLLTAVAILSALRGGHQTPWLFLYVLMLGLGEGSRSSLITAVASDLFPGSALGAINGSVGAAFGVGAAFFPWLAGYMFDRFGAYTIAFIAAAVGIVVSTLALWLAPAAAGREQPTDTP
jgi:sugar phosphate permease